MKRTLEKLIFGTALLLCSLGTVRGGTATGVNGLYYTGINNSGGLLTGGSQDSHWAVTYASANGTTDNASYQGNSYVVSSSYVDSGWVKNTTAAQWIVPPGAMTAATGGTANSGGDYLPGNGTSGTNAASFIYTLAFNIDGSGSGAVTNQVSISLTLAADDQAKVYVNPSLNADGSINTASSTPSKTLTSAWSNTTVTTLQNYTGGGNTNNANFVIGTNYLVIQVDNTNSLTGTQSSAALNPGGLLVYQVGAIATIDGTKIVPEVGAWLPILAALGLFCWHRFRTVKPASVA